jgi:hypothetical protein
MCDILTAQKTSLFIIEKTILSLERMLVKEYDHKVSIAKTVLAMSYKALGAKAN